MSRFDHKALTAGPIIAILALSACSNSGTSNSGGTAGAGATATAPTLVEAVNFANLAEDDMTRIAGNGVTGGIPGTAFGPLRATTTGTATYTGPGSVSIFERQTSGSNTVDTSVVDMLGTATVTVDFSGVTLTGRIRDMFAVDDAGGTDLVAGEVTVANGVQADAAGRPTLMEADATGSLEAFGTTYDITVGLEGLLRGTNNAAPDNIPVRALDLSGEGTVAGSTLLSEIIIVGDKDAANQGAFVNR